MQHSTRALGTAAHTTCVWPSPALHRASPHPGWHPVASCSGAIPAAQRAPWGAHGFAADRESVSRAPRLTPSALSTPDSGAEASFYSSEHASFAGLGVSPAVQSALEAIGLSRPSKIQELAAPQVLRGRNTVIAAETGSGKTLAYLVPIAHLMLRQRAALLQQKQQQEEEQREQQQHEGGGSAGPRPPPRRYHALVLCPNTTLCQQVVAAVSSLRSADGTALVTAAHINSSHPPPFDAPDVIVATPAGLLTILNDAGEHSHDVAQLEQQPLVVATSAEALPSASCCMALVALRATGAEQGVT
ncbi:DEAD-box ATP-dependent RNA helicase 22 [Tetrabaena socialis]|uniref:DEAD-box ATP-dependent RNA helicase 22 n=1 Tax=Tetrabaena socialis TaxID=47790 RepID=A0A2J8AJI2_9CHLO|nr:DEAD-box ATP-dependent RNA helicase 22 [Tetrabaena socialis]|eukprot:PNH12674.1 DEAD-box ATP-dependent RNA helicase 22 [Tetrabaena socialis]